ncbi:hypothetical protein [Bdellovibrio sp. HCB337]|uniref:hypothetical protein n=1 Tax=Bdellovibrio sp. HCB337 TaxID=3394358 RepID=UPI0039A625D3
MSSQRKIAGWVLGMVLAGQPLLAADSKAVAVPSPNEAKIMSALVEQVLNSIDKASLDIEFDGLSIQGGNGENKIEADYASLSGMVQFNRDWNVDIMPPGTGGNVDPQISRLYPEVGADSKNLVAGVSVVMRGQNIDTSLRFFSGYDSKSQSWLARPLTLQVSNQMNKALLSIRLHSLSAKVTANAVNPSQKDVKGTCESDKMLLDLVTGKNKIVKVGCEFDGNFSDKGYQINFKYMNR